MTDPILLQKALRENTNDIFEFSKDLKKWGEEMKRKEESFKKDMQDTFDQKKGPKGHKKRKSSRSDKGKSPATKIGGTDYAAWDKFDVDAELNKLEGDGDDSDLTDECNEEKYDEAIIEKEKGNKFVKSQEWARAAECYTKAIGHYSYDPIFYANRALCYLKLEKYEEAENDCNLSIKLDDTYVKAYQRRAAARMKLNKLEHAEVDLQKVLIIEPNNKESKSELLKLSVTLNRERDKDKQRAVSKFTASRNKLHSNNFSNFSKDDLVQKQIKVSDKQIDNSKSVPQWLKSDDLIEVMPIKKPPHMRSKEPLKRIKITEIDGFETNEKPVKKHVVEKREETIEIKENSEQLIKEIPQQPMKENSLESNKPISAFKKQKCNKTVPEEPVSSTSLPQPGSDLSCLRTEALKVLERIDSSTTPKDIKNTVNDNKKLTETIDSEVKMVYPNNSVQFQTCWKNLSSNSERYKYFKMIKPQDLPKLFLHSMDSNIFSGILELLVNDFIANRDEVYEVLAHLTQVKRFGAIVMFMSGDDKSNLWKLLDYIKETNEKEKEDVDRLIEKFEL
ncbi:unnamed protein product [Phyllotreta striolata]|uniref:RNA polymerase II-associated protein 3 n=1 Tax=Phyllotreta striolata TaxID=444603 RepID=A0A9N9TY84_PHYSR|nr:unnamed protein product [Phyllotreta striolata]